jgi:hypothetical protein
MSNRTKPERPASRKNVKTGLTRNLKGNRGIPEQNSASHFRLVQNCESKKHKSKPEGCALVEIGENRNASKQQKQFASQAIHEPEIQRLFVLGFWAVKIRKRTYYCGRLHFFGPKQARWYWQ